MWNPNTHPTITPILTALLAALRQTLGGQFAGLYLYGSLASGDFNPQTSDIDFLAVTTGELSTTQNAAIQAMHARLWASGDPWAAKLEGSYMPLAALRRYSPDAPPRPTVNEGRFEMAAHGTDWVIQRHILREQGVIVAGPPLADLIDPVSPEAMRSALRDTLRDWWLPMLDRPRLADSDYQAYAVLTMCRTLYTLEHGDIASKPVSARWAQTALAARWHGLISEALNWRAGEPMDRLGEVQAFIRHTLAQANVEGRPPLV